MEELGVMQLKVIEPYHMNDQYPQVEDLVRDAGVLISKSQASLMGEYYDLKAKGREINQEIVIAHANMILKYVLALMYCFEIDIPDEEEVEEHYEEEVPQLISSDVILTLFNIQYHISGMVLHYWDCVDAGDDVDKVVIYDGCMDIFAALKMICEKYSFTMQDLIFV
ncbi:hypothetical protein D3C87_279610 [compost metagenome]